MGEISIEKLEKEVFENKQSLITLSELLEQAMDQLISLNVIIEEMLEEKLEGVSNEKANWFKKWIVSTEKPV